MAQLVQVEQVILGPRRAGEVPPEPVRALLDELLVEVAGLGEGDTVVQLVEQPPQARKRVCGCLGGEFGGGEQPVGDRGEHSAVPNSCALKISRVVWDQQMAAYRGSCSRSSTWASPSATRSLPSMPISHFTGSWYQQKFWIRSCVISARPCSPAIHSSAARASSAATASCSASFARAAAISGFSSTSTTVTPPPAARR